MKYFRCITEQTSDSVGKELQGIEASLTGNSHKVTLADFGESFDV